MTRSLPTLLFLSGLTLTLGTACTDDALSTIDDEPASSSSSDELSPLETGDYGYFISAAYRPGTRADPVSSANRGASGSEPAISELSAHLCISVSTIRDTARLEFAEAEETVLEGELRLTGIASDSLTLRDTSAAASIQGLSSTAPVDTERATPSDVNHAKRESVEQSRTTPLAPLWIKRVVAPQSDSIPTEQRETFFLEQGLRPTITLDRLAFMEVRALDDWHGWDDTVSDSLAWFHEPPLSLGTNAFFDDDIIDFAHSEGPDGYGFTMVWREDGIGLPSAFDGTVVHSLRVEYGADGVLAQLAETIVPDLEPTSSLDAASAELSCIDTEPCLTAVVQNEAFERLYCRF